MDLAFDGEDISIKSIAVDEGETAKTPCLPSTARTSLSATKALSKSNLMNYLTYAQQATKTKK